MSDRLAREVCHFYSAFPQWFDAATGAVRGEKDVRFYLARAVEAAGRCCELGAGTGRVLLPVARAGVTIDGVELAEPMLEVLRERLAREAADVRERVRLFRADMREPLPGRYDLVSCPFRGFQHLLQLDDQRRALRSVGDALTARGRFVFDLFHPSLELLASPPKRVPSVAQRDPQSGEELVRYDSLSVDRVRQCLDVEMRWEREHADGRRTREARVCASLRWFELPELELLLESNGMRVLELYGDFEGAPFSADSAEIVLVCGARN